MNRSRNLLGLAAAWLVLALAAQAVEDRPLIEKKPAGKEPTTDQEFLIWAVSCEVSEVQFAERAVKKAKNADVRKLAQTILDHHTRSRDALLDKAKAMKVGVVAGLEKHHREAFDRLGKLEGEAFDREYARYLVEGHEKGVQMYQKWAKMASDSGLRDLASRALLHCKDHLEQARTLSAKLKP